MIEDHNFRNIWNFCSKQKNCVLIGWLAVITKRAWEGFYRVRTGLFHELSFRFLRIFCDYPLLSYNVGVSKSFFITTFLLFLFRLSPSPTNTNMNPLNSPCLSASLLSDWLAGQEMPVDIEEIQKELESNSALALFQEIDSS